VGNVTLELLTPGSDNAVGGSGSAADAVVATTSTDAAGAYSFKTYTPGKYYVRLARTSALQLPSSTAGGDDGVMATTTARRPAASARWCCLPWWI